MRRGPGIGAAPAAAGAGTELGRSAAQLDRRRLERVGLSDVPAPPPPRRDVALGPDPDPHRRVVGPKARTDEVAGRSVEPPDGRGHAATSVAPRPASAASTSAASVARLIETVPVSDPVNTFGVRPGVSAAMRAVSSRARSDSDS